MYAEDQLLPISALQHLLFCERQCALIHIERLWAENRLTAEGRLLHTRAHDGRASRSGALRVARGLALRSMRLGLTGYADVVEFHAPSDGGSAQRLVPIEYKRGKPKIHDADRVQLCAQAMCLEEMLTVPVPSGQIFYGETRRREDVVFDESLRGTTEAASDRLHALIAVGETPTARREPKCDACSLLDLCLPGAAERGESARNHFDRALERALSLAPEPDEE